MRLLVTADLHYNHLKSKALADELIDAMNAAGGDVLLLVGDTAAADGDALERCLARFRFGGPKLFVPGNHELWTAGPDSHLLYSQILPRRVREMGWRWLEAEPFVAGDVAIVGSLGWYDYSFAQPGLGIPRRFYEHKVSPGAAERYAEFAHLFERTDDIPPHAREIIARWNDGKFAKLGMADEQFLGGMLGRLERQLESVGRARHVIAAVHHLPFRELLPSPRNAQWDFAKAYLGSERIGEMLLRFPNVRHVYCGHSHLAVEAKVGNLHAINIGSGYRWKTFRELDA
ncbi:MAG TPA: metallophosphoesterase [Tepidisphaeraceae bacterium]|jgi:3',5'-cyclic AMP phosphodiesterase CpdA|nr:metallophosphoesterase [Tepidisphaeraceae bacterium]